MADNTVLNAGAGGDTVATDDVGGIKFQRVKMNFGADGAAQDVDATHPMPVDGSSVTQPVSAVSLPLPTGASTGAKQDTGNTSIASVDTKIGEVQASPTANTVLDRLKALLTGISLAAGTAAIGKLAANSGVDIGDVDVTSVPADPFGVNADAAVAAGAAGSIQAKLRRLTQGVEDLKTGIVLAAGTAAFGKLSANSGVDIGDVDVTSVPADPFGANADAVVAAGAAGSIQAKLRRVTQGLEDLKTGIVLAAGTAGIGKLTANAGVTIGAVEIAAAQTLATVTTVSTVTTLTTLTGSSIAHDGVDSGNPHKIGGRAIAHGTNPTAVAAADRTDWLFNRAGVPFMIGGHPNIVTVEAAYTAAQTDTAIVTISTGLKIVVTSIQATCDNANTVNTAIRVGFGTANTPTTTGVVLTHPGIPAGSGVGRGDGSGIIGVGADNEDLRITSGVPTTGSLRVVVSYFTIET